MRKLPKQIIVHFTNGVMAELLVEEFHPYEPAAYVHDPGWTCFHPISNKEYFVSESGRVCVQPDNNDVGVAPEIKQIADEVERELDEAMEHSGD